MVEPGQVRVVGPAIVRTGQVPFADRRGGIAGIGGGLERVGQGEFFRQEDRPWQRTVRSQGRIRFVCGFSGRPGRNLGRWPHWAAAHRSADAGSKTVAAGDDRGPGGRTDRLGPEIGEPHTFVGQFVECRRRRRVFRNAVRRKGIHTHVVADDEQDIGRGLRAAPKEATYRRRQQGFFRYTHIKRNSADSGLRTQDSGLRTQDSGK